MPARRPRDLLLLCEADLAGEPGFYLSTLDYRRFALVAILVPIRCGCRCGSTVVDRAAAAWSSGRIPVFRGNSVSSAGIPERISVYLFLCRRPLPIFSESGNYRASIGRDGARHAAIAFVSAVSDLRSE